MNKPTLGIVAVLGVVAMLSAGLVALPVQVAQAGGDGADTEFEFKQKQKNACSGFATCTNDALVTFSPVVAPVLN